MKTQLYPITLICIVILICSSCSITRQTTCPTFANKSEKVHKSFFSKKQYSKKEKKIASQTKKEKTQHTNLTPNENIISKIEMNDITVSSNNDIVLNSTGIAPSFIESKLQKFIYKKIEKRSKKIFKNLEKHNQKKGIEEKEDYEQVVPKKKRKKKSKKIFNSNNDGPTSERETHDLAILSLLSGILTFITPLFVSLIGGWFLIPTLLFGIFAIVSGVVGRKLIKEKPYKYKGEGMALTGFILGTVALGILILFIAYLILLFSTLGY